MTFRDFFQSATGNPPYDYQSRLAGSDSGTSCHSQFINIPTGLGKKATVVLAWLWNRVYPQDRNSNLDNRTSPWPRPFGLLALDPGNWRKRERGIALHDVE